MADVGRRARHLGPDFHLVSISVDPERDTPARLAEYGARYGANPIAWSFLTGPEQAIQATVVEGFKIGAGKERRSGAPADGGAGFWRSSTARTWCWSNRQLRIRGYFPATAEGIDKLMEAVGRVASGA
jgi:cytochrome oxidase Cu insertion factor (SCO1/SenC/PrrC family)